MAIQNLSDYRWIVFTSQNGIRIFFDRVRACAVDLRKFADIRFAVVGSGCAQALEQYGFYADYIPEQYTTESLANGICAVVKSGEKVLIPRAKEGSPVLEQILSANRIDAEIEQPDWNPAQGKKRIVLGTIGQVTADALIKCGLPADVVPEQCDAEGLVRALDIAFDMKKTDNNKE